MPPWTFVRESFTSVILVPHWGQCTLLFPWEKPLEVEVSKSTKNESRAVPLFQPPSPRDAAYSNNFKEAIVGGTMLLL